MTGLQSPADMSDAELLDAFERQCISCRYPAIRAQQKAELLRRLTEGQK